MCARIWYLSFSFWLTSLCKIGSRFIHLIKSDSNAFISMIEEYSIVYMCHNFFIHSSVDGHLGCFQVLPILDSAAMNNGIHVFFNFGSSGYMPKSGNAGPYSGFSPSCLRNLHTIFHSGYINLHSHQQCSLFSIPSPALTVCRLFDDGHLPLWGDISLSFHLNFSNNEWYWASFHEFVTHLYVFFGEKFL